MDESGISMDSLRESGANIVHVLGDFSLSSWTVIDQAEFSLGAVSWSRGSLATSSRDDYDCRSSASPTKSIPCPVEYGSKPPGHLRGTPSARVRSPGYPYQRYMVIPRKPGWSTISRVLTLLRIPRIQTASSMSWRGLLKSASSERQSRATEKYLPSEGERLFAHHQAEQPFNSCLPYHRRKLQVPSSGIPGYPHY